jgi:hypothetical protein
VIEKKPTLAPVRRLQAVGDACREDKEEIVKHYKKVYAN